MKLSCFSYALAEEVETLEHLLNDNPDWDLDKIRQKIGIEKRHVSNESETGLSMAVKSTLQTLEIYGDRSSIDGIIYVTQSPDSRIPATACLLHAKLGLSRSCAAFDVNQGCSGFSYALSIGKGMIECCGLKNCLIVCAETYTKYISNDDRTNRAIFSDAASSVVLSSDGNSEIGPFIFMTDGTGAPNLALKEGGKGSETLFMDGPKVLMFTMSAVPGAVRTLLEKSELETGDIDLFIFHQASKLVIDNLERLLKLDPDKVFRNYQSIGNTVSSTIPIALQECIDENRLRPGMTALLVGFGVGYSLSGCVYRN